MNLYAYVGNDPTNLLDPMGLIAFFANFQIVFQVGSIGGRVDVSVGYDTENGVFGSVNAGGSTKINGGEDAAGLQAGAGAGVGVAESSDVITTPAVTTDVDLGAGSVSVVTNDPSLSGKGNGNSKGGDKGSAGGKGGSQKRDTKIRAVVVSGGLGVGGSQIKTAPVASYTDKGGFTSGSQSGGKAQTSKPASQQSGAKACTQTKQGRSFN